MIFCSFELGWNLGNTVGDAVTAELVKIEQGASTSDGGSTGHGASTSTQNRSSTRWSQRS